MKIPHLFYEAQQTNQRMSWPGLHRLDDAPHISSYGEETKLLVEALYSPIHK